MTIMALCAFVVVVAIAWAIKDVFNEPDGDL